MATKAQPAGGGGTSNGEKQAWDAINSVLSGKKSWGEVLGINSGHAYNMAQLGYKMLQEGKLEEAHVIFKGLATLNPKDPYHHLALGSVHHRSDRIDDAIGEYSKAIELDGKLANAYANRGELLIAKGQLEKAYADLSKARDLDPNCQDPSTIRARAILNTALDMHKQRKASGAKPGAAAAKAAAKLAAVKPAAQKKK
jgi:tetratricopeptide (TPR) repeat protein